MNSYNKLLKKRTKSEDTNMTINLQVVVQLVIEERMNSSP